MAINSIAPVTFSLSTHSNQKCVLETFNFKASSQGVARRIWTYDEHHLDADNAEIGRI